MRGSRTTKPSALRSLKGVVPALTTLAILTRVHKKKEQPRENPFPPAPRAPCHLSPGGHQALWALDKGFAYLRI